MAEPLRDPLVHLSPLHLSLLCDSGDGVGAGHMVRQLSVARAWRERGGSVSLHTPGSIPGWLSGAYENAGVSVFPETQRLAAAERADVYLVDSYRVDRDHLRSLRDNGLLVLTDDFHQLDGHPCDVLLDHNPGANESDYPDREPGTHVLLGSTYTLVRPEFLAARTSPVAAQGRRSGSQGDSPTVLLTLGGDPTVDQLARTEAEIRKLVPKATLLVADGTISDMATFMSQADLAVSASGSTIYELCVLGIPSIVVPIVENQRALARTLNDVGAAVASTLTEAPAELAKLAADPGRQDELRKRSMSLIDGRGPERVVEQLLTLVIKR